MRSIKFNLNGTSEVREVPEPTIDIKAEAFDSIERFKAQLAATDYKAIKYAEGLISEDDYAPIKAERQALRDRINELEAEL